MRLATEVLRRIVCSDAKHEIAWTAADGAEAVRRCQQDTPDVILMDLIMPVMNGAEATRRIMQATPCAVLVVTATVAGNFELVCEALGHGAYDAVGTSELGDKPLAVAGAEILQKLASGGRSRQSSPQASELPDNDSGVVAQSARRGPAAASPPLAPLVVIGASTGGPPALGTLLNHWPTGFPAPS